MADQNNPIDPNIIPTLDPSESIEMHQYLSRLIQPQKIIEDLLTLE